LRAEATENVYLGRIMVNGEPVDTITGETLEELRARFATWLERWA